MKVILTMMNGQLKSEVMEVDSPHFNFEELSKFVGLGEISKADVQKGKSYTFTKTGRVMTDFDGNQIWEMECK